jgi:hypothetical protein
MRRRISGRRRNSNAAIRTADVFLDFVSVLKFAFFHRLLVMKPC